MSTIHLLIGPVGSGKSTFARRLKAEHGALRLTLDEWMARLFRDDRPAEGLVAWYRERAERCVAQIWDVAQEALSLGTDVILEIGLLERQQREAFYWLVDPHPAQLRVYVVDAPRDVRRERVARRNTTEEAGGRVVPPQIFEMASDMWEPPTAEEREGREFVDVSTG